MHSLSISDDEAAFIVPRRLFADDSGELPLP